MCSMEHKEGEKSISLMDKAHCDPLYLIEKERVIHQSFLSREARFGQRADRETWK